MGSPEEARNRVGAGSQAVVGSPVAVRSRAEAAHTREGAGARRTRAAVRRPVVVREVVRSLAAVREEVRSQVADSRLGWDYRPKDRSGRQGAPEVGS